MNLSEALRTSILANDAVTRLLGTYNNLPSVIVRRRLPADVIDGVGQPFVLISQNTGYTGLDIIRKDMPLVLRQISVYGAQNRDQKAVEDAAEAIRVMLHHKKFAISVTGYRVIDITASWPLVAPDDNPNGSNVGRIVMCSFKFEAVSERV